MRQRAYRRNAAHPKITPWVGRRDDTEPNEDEEFGDDESEGRPDQPGRDRGKGKGKGKGSLTISRPPESTTSEASTPTPSSSLPETSADTTALSTSSTLSKSTAMSESHTNVVAPVHQAGDWNCHHQKQSRYVFGCAGSILINKPGQALSGNSGLDSGQIAGIVVGSVAFLIFTAVAVLFVWRRRRSPNHFSKARSMFNHGENWPATHEPNQDMEEALLQRAEAQPFHNQAATTINKPKPALRLSMWLRRSDHFSTHHTRPAAHDDGPSSDTTSVLSLPTTIATSRGNTNSTFLPTTPLHYPVRHPDPVPPPLPRPAPPIPEQPRHQQHEQQQPCSAWSDSSSATTHTTSDSENTDATDSTSQATAHEPSTLAFLLHSGPSLRLAVSAPDH
ncbi:hypothetical protein N657DRAFT_635666 [Parathielavia appendiculata]|uniref:Uncharacterized protein n=1 Tax=Parathielavia appendiculata TaxID=2587402 RepID=A0AAN6TX02_9PEZI|nr:hypothetical protein N657DRAFT_635666 [Parathielavia appendiculata]